MAQKLTSAQRKKFEAQAAHARRIMDGAVDSEGVITNKTSYESAAKARKRALKMLGRGGSFPNKTDSGVPPKRKGSSTKARIVGGLVGGAAKKLSPREAVRKLEGVQERAEAGGGGRPKGVDEKTYKKYFGDK